MLDLGIALENALESIARKRATSVEDLLKERVIQEWIGKRHLVNESLFDEPSKRTRRTDNRSIVPRTDRKDPS